MLKIKDNFNLDDLRKLSITNYPLTFFRLEETPEYFYIKINEYKDNFGNRYREYLQIDRVTRIITDYLECYARKLIWKTNDLELEHMPFSIINVVEKVED